MLLKKAKKMIILTAIMFITHYASMAQNQDKSKYIEVYKGTRGLTVYVTRYGDFEKNQSLVKITGFDHPWSNRVFLCNTTVWPWGDAIKVTYTTKIDDKDYELMKTIGDAGTIWLKGGLEFNVVYSGTSEESME